MKHFKLRLFMLILLICLAAASVAFAFKPLVDGAKKNIEVKQAVEEYQETVTEIRKDSEKKEEIIPHSSSTLHVHPNTHYQLHQHLGNHIPKCTSIH